MSDVGILTFAALPSPGDQVRRNALSDAEERLRAALAARDIEVAFGGEPFHPGDRVIGSLALGRLHLQHVLDTGCAVVLLLLAGDVDAGLAGALVRYLDARATPPLPVFLLGLDEDGLRGAGALLAAAGELRAAGRPHDATLAAIEAGDGRFHAFRERLRKSAEDAIPVTRDLRFRDDLRRHHHLSVCPTGTAPPSWRLAPLQALERHGVTAGVVPDDEVRTRMRWILGAGGEVLDPRLMEIREASRDWHPGELAAHAAALAIRDLADERLATTVTLGSRLPAGADPERVRAILCARRAGDGGPAIPICASTGDDDAGAFSRYLLQRAAAAGKSDQFRDPQHARPREAAHELRIAALDDGHALLRGAPPDALAALAAGPVTALRVAFGAKASTAALIETPEPPRPDDGGLTIALPAPRTELLRWWPADRMAVIPGRHARRLAALLGACGFSVTSAAQHE